MRSVKSMWRWIEPQTRGNGMGSRDVFRCKRVCSERMARGITGLSLKGICDIAPASQTEAVRYAFFVAIVLIVRRHLHVVLIFMLNLRSNSQAKRAMACREFCCNLAGYGAACY